MSDSDLIRPHDPFSGHEVEPPAAETPKPEKSAPAPTPPAEPAPKRKPGRRPRRVPSASQVEASARKARR